jgi:hypothetical protein
MIIGCASPTGYLQIAILNMERIPQPVSCKQIPNSATMSRHRKLELHYYHQLCGWEYGMTSASGTSVVPLSFQGQQGLRAGASRE